MDKFNKLMVMQEYIKDMEYHYSELKKLSKFINFKSENQRKALKETLKITKSKIKELKKCQTLKEFNAVIDVDKVIKKEGETYERRRRTRWH